jgi:GT2 family glycosyltransferase
MKRLHAEHPEAGAVGGPVIGANADSLVSRISDRVTFSSYPTARTVRTLPGVNVSYKRAVVEQVGAQDETLFRGEDVDYNWRAQRLGWTILYDPRVRVLHHHRPTLRAFLNQHYMYGRAYYLVRRKWPEMYCIYPHRLGRPKDLMKAANFVAGMLYEPVEYGLRMERATDKLLAVPILFVNALCWRGGMVRQKLIAQSSI